MIRKSFLSAIFLVTIAFPALADEGMWIPLLLNKNEADMQAKGMKLTADDIYSMNHSSLKDAVVHFGSGCTGEFVSDEGLVLTNYHCGYGQIQYHSSLEHDYLRTGFWAMKRQEELPCPGLNVTLLVKIEDITDQVLQGVTETMNEKQADSIRKINLKTIVNKAKETGYKVEYKAFFGGLQYYLFYNEVFEDVRLVGAPPSNIGKFGGDTDNWMWPRHTGDFSVFRVYADTNNKASEYNVGNKPYQPKQHLKISLKGIQENDFTFVFGYPGTTNEYLASYAIEQTTEIENPIRINARTTRLDIIKAAMNKDPLVRIQYSAKANSISNGWKKWQGENHGIKKLDGIAKKQAFEKQFQQWANSYNNGQYKNLLNDLKQAYQDANPYSVQSLYYNEQIKAPEIVPFVEKFIRIIAMADNKKTKAEDFQRSIDSLKNSIAPFFKNYNIAVDKQLFKNLSLINNSDFPYHYNGFPDKNFDNYVDKLYAQTVFSDKDKLAKFIDGLSLSNASKLLLKDNLLIYVKYMSDIYNTGILPALQDKRSRITALQRTYMKAQMEMQPDKTFYPDANSTLRVAYGKVDGFKPADGIIYNYYTTLSGLIAKGNPEIFDYTVEDKLKDLYVRKDFGRYGNADGEMPLAFIASNHTTGGNSGSPVLNSNGELLGLNFDRAWEGTMSDLMYDPDQCRNITLDIRFCLFIIDKFANAKHLIEEMSLVE